MKIVVLESVFGKILEFITSDRVICDSCGWVWKLSEGGDDPYVCHKCGHDNSTNPLSESKATCQGIDDFLSVVRNRYPESESIIEKIENFIMESGCERIEIQNLRVAQGAALSDRVIISKFAFTRAFDVFLFILFHEIAHQFQYKKYGAKKMYELYLDHVPVSDAAKFMKQAESTADEFARRKVRSLLGNKTDLISHIHKGYDNVPLSHFEDLIIRIKNRTDIASSENVDEVSEKLYNYIKNSL